LDPRLAVAATAAKDQKISSEFFRLEVKGLYDAVPGVTSVDPGRLRVTTEEATQGDKPEYRTYTYGSHEYDDMTFTVQTGPGMTKLQEWADKAMKMGGAGTALRRDVSLYLLARDKTTVLRTIHMFGCYPVSRNAGDHDTSSSIKTLVFTCNVDRIEEAKG
jgi:hypothetical protein